MKLDYYPLRCSFDNAVDTDYAINNILLLRLLLMMTLINNDEVCFPVYSYSSTTMPPLHPPPSGWLGTKLIATSHLALLLLTRWWPSFLDLNSSDIIMIQNIDPYLRIYLRIYQIHTPRSECDIRTIFCRINPMWILLNRLPHQS